MTSNPSRRGNHLFTVPIQSLPSAEKEVAAGSIDCTAISSSLGPIYILTFIAPPDNRLLTTFIKALLQALDILEFLHPHGVVVTTSGIPKFYSNGLDLNHAKETPDFFSQHLFAAFKRFLTYPMPTIALVNGHAFAAGCMLAMYHDYRVMNPTRGFLCLNELEFGATLQPAMSSIFRQKLHPTPYKQMVLEAQRFTGEQALKEALVDVLGGLPEVFALIEERHLAAKTGTRIYGLLRAEMFRETLNYIDSYDEEVKRSEKFLEEEANRKEIGYKSVERWRLDSQKSNL